MGYNSETIPSVFSRWSKISCDVVEYDSLEDAFRCLDSLSGEFHVEHSDSLADYYVVKEGAGQLICGQGDSPYFNEGNAQTCARRVMEKTGVETRVVRLAPLNMYVPATYQVYEMFPVQCTNVTALPTFEGVGRAIEFAWQSAVSCLEYVRMNHPEMDCGIKRDEGILYDRFSIECKPKE